MQYNNEYMPTSEENDNKKKIKPLLIIIPSVLLVLVVILAIIGFAFINNPKNKVMRALASALGDSFPFTEYVKDLKLTTGSPSSFFEDPETMEQLKTAYDNRQFYTSSSFKLNSAKLGNSSFDTSYLSGIKLDSSLYVDKPGRKIQCRMTPGYMIIKAPELIFTEDDNIFSFYAPTLFDTPVTIDTENFGPDYNSSDIADIIGYHFPANIENDLKFNPFELYEDLDSGDNPPASNVSKSSLKDLYDAIEVKKTGKKEYISFNVGQSEECTEYLVNIPGRELGNIILPVLNSYDDKSTSFFNDNTDLLNALCVTTGSDLDLIRSDYEDEWESFITKVEDILSDDISMSVWLNDKDEVRKVESEFLIWDRAESGNAEGSYELTLYITGQADTDIALIVSRKCSTVKNKTKTKSNHDEYDVRIDNISDNSELISLKYVSDYDCDDSIMKLSGTLSYEEYKFTLEGDCDVTIERDVTPSITFDFDHINIVCTEDGVDTGSFDISEEFTLAVISEDVYKEMPSSSTPLFKMTSDEIYNTISDGINDYLSNTWSFGSSSGAAITPDQVELMLNNPYLLALLTSGL